MENTKVLIISYYWPPSGGAGVQRWVKLTKYFHEHNLTPYVITVDENQASYMQLDESLNKEVGENVQVFKTKSFEPINYYSKLVGKKNVPTAGFSNVDNKSFSQKAVNALRSNLFVPDPRKGWNKYAFQKAVEVVKAEGIKLVITTSPPHSTQLVGLKLKKNLGLKWIADLRDPWTDIYYYDILGHSKYSKKRDLAYEKEVLEKSDAVLTVSKSLKNLFESKSKNVRSNKIHELPNGFDHADYQGLVKIQNKEFVITYTGTMSDEYHPEVFFDALKDVLKEQKNVKCVLQIVGGRVSESIKNHITETGIFVDYVDYVHHDKIVQYQKNANLLLLVIPEVQNSKGILTGKMFEYLASENPLIGIGPEDGDAAAIINKCGVGQVFSRKRKEEIRNYIKQQLDLFQKGEQLQVNKEEMDKYSRRNQAKLVKEIIEKLR